MDRLNSEKLLICLENGWLRVIKTFAQKQLCFFEPVVLRGNQEKLSLGYHFRLSKYLVLNTESMRKPDH